MTRVQARMIQSVLGSNGIKSNAPRCDSRIAYQTLRLPRARESRSSARFMRPRPRTGKDNVATWNHGRFRRSAATWRCHRSTFHFGDPSRSPRNRGSFAFIMHRSVTLIDNLLILRKIVISRFLSFDFVEMYAAVECKYDFYVWWLKLKLEK